MANSKKVLIYGGSFDPPHLGHIQLLQNALASVSAQDVYIIPTGQPPHKQPLQTPGALRLKMCSCFTEVFPKAVISDMEIQKSGKSYTYQTINTIKRDYIKHEINAQIYLCVGADMLLSFNKWKNAQEIMQKATLVCALRQTEHKEEVFEAAEKLREKGAKVIFASGNIVEISSSEIRDALKKPESRANALKHVPQNVAALIEKHNLYT